MQQGQIDAAVMLDPSVTVLQGSYPDLKILADTRTEKGYACRVRREYPVVRSYDHGVDQVAREGSRR
jgi:NitT/TauT family transport system substrate-binding protein